LKGSLVVKKSVVIIKKNKEIVAIREKEAKKEKETRFRCVIFSYFRTEMRKTHFHSFVFSSPGYNYFNKKNVKHFFVVETQYRVIKFLFQFFAGRSRLIKTNYVNDINFNKITIPSIIHILFIIIAVIAAPVHHPLM
jgi:hypothetical protein